MRWRRFRSGGARIRSGPQRLRNVFSAIASAYFEGSLRETPAARRAIYDFYAGNRARIDNWDLVDCSASQIVGAHLQDRAKTFLTTLAKSPRVWDRRIAVIATHHYIKQGECADTLHIARLLLDDPHDLIHKAVGWLLREVAHRDRALVERFLREYADRMPRTMLRYAIERLPPPLRARYMAIPPRRRARHTPNRA